MSVPDPFSIHSRTPFIQLAVREVWKVLSGRALPHVSGHFFVLFPISHQKKNQIFGVLARWGRARARRLASRRMSPGLAEGA